MTNNKLRRKRAIYTALFVLLLLIAGLMNQQIYAQSTIGTDFWVTFLPNYDDNTEIMLIAAGTKNCTGTVSNPNTNWTKNFSVSPGVTTNISIPRDQAYESGSDRVINKGLHIVSTDSISLYASNFMQYSFDVTDILPTASLGSEYIIQAYPTPNKETKSTTDSMIDRFVDHTEFTVVAVENNTKVNFLLTCNSINGHYANQSFSINMNAGQCYQLQSVVGKDFSGSQVLVEDGKKVAVFAGNLCAVVPNGYCCCDHIVEQMMPVSCWGKKFVVINSKMRSKDIVRITSLKNGCKIWKNGTLMTTINANRTYQFEMTSSIPAIYIETSEPVQVYLYFTGSHFGGENGDPSMVIINPIEQRIKDVTFSTFNSGTSRYHYVNIATDSDKTSSMRLDGNNISSQFQTVPGNHNYAYARVQVNHGSHTLSNSNGGFVAHVYGLGVDESYSYSVGSMAKNLSSLLLVDGQIASEHPNGFNICGNDAITFDLDLNFDYARILWSFGDGQTSTICPVSHSFDTTGNYIVSCEIYTEEEGTETLVSTLNTIISVHDTYTTDLFETHCDSYRWYGTTYTQSGDYMHHAHSINGCDSLLRLHLTIDHIETHLQENACDEYEWHGTIYNHSGIFEHTLQTPDGCDSLLVLNLTVNPSETTHHVAVSCDEYEWKGQRYTQTGMYEHYEGQTINGCDSTAILDLSINRTPQIDILGFSQVAYASSQWHGIYHYYVVDSTALEPESITWSCSNPDWILVPISDFHCMAIVKTEGFATLSATTNLSTGCDTSTSKEIYASNFGVNDEEESSALMFPNPAQTKVTIVAPELSHIRLLNTFGQAVKEMDTERTNSVTITIDDLTQGLYLVEIQTIFGKVAKKLVISR